MPSFERVNFYIRRSVRTALSPGHYLVASSITEGSWLPPSQCQVHFRFLIAFICWCSSPSGLLEVHADSSWRWLLRIPCNVCIYCRLNPREHRRRKGLREHSHCSLWEQGQCDE